MKNIILFGPMGAGKTTIANMICAFTGGEYYRASLGEDISVLAKKYGAGLRHEKQLVGQTFREIFGQDVWNKRLYDKLAGFRRLCVVIDDGRQENELNFWEERGYLAIGVIADENIRAERLKKRDGYEQKEWMDHPNELSAIKIAEEKCEFCIKNNGTLDELEDKVKHILRVVEAAKTIEIYHKRPMGMYEGY